MRLQDKAANDAPGNETLSDVVEEHLEELEFCVAKLQRTHEHPLMTLRELTRNAEARLSAHVDALVVAGPDAALEGMRKRAEELDPGEPQGAMALGLVAAATGLDGLLQQLFAHEDRGVRLAAARGCSLAASPRIDEAATTRVAAAKTPGELGAWLELLGRRNLKPAAAAALVTSAEGSIVASALRCLRQPIPSLGAALEGLAEHPNPLFRERALRIALAWGTPRAFAICESQALDEGQVAPHAMLAYAILGGPSQHLRLAQSARTKERMPHVLRALGFTGSVGLVPALLEVLGAKSPLDAKLAAQAVVAITGLDLRKDEFAAKPPPRADSLPPLEEDELDADLVPQPEDELPEPNVEAIRAWWRMRERELNNSQRLVLGEPRSPEGLLWALESGPLGLRHGWALAAHLWSGGRFWLDTEALSTEQRRHLAVARADIVRWPSPAWATERRGDVGTGQ